MKKYCLDTNVLIEPWNKYYTIEICPDYWEIIDRLAKQGVIFCPEEVRREIDKIDDELKKWVKSRPHLFREINQTVQVRLREVLERFPRLVDTVKDRSMADPWVIAYAMTENAVVVTKEGPTNGHTPRIRIPDVCNALSIEWMDDHNFVSELGIRFSARLS